MSLKCGVKLCEGVTLMCRAGSPQIAEKEVHFWHHAQFVMYDIWILADTGQPTFVSQTGHRHMVLGLLKHVYKTIINGVLSDRSRISILALSTGKKYCFRIGFLIWIMMAALVTEHDLCGKWLANVCLFSVIFSMNDGHVWLSEISLGHFETLIYNFSGTLIYNWNMIWFAFNEAWPPMKMWLFFR